MQRPFSIRQLCSLFSVLTLLLCGTTVAMGQDWQWISASAAEGTASGWYRWAIDPAAFGKDGSVTKLLAEIKTP